MTDNSPILKRIYNIAIEYIKNPLIDISLIFDYLKNTRYTIIINTLMKDPIFKNCINNNENTIQPKINRKLLLSKFIEYDNYINFLDDNIIIENLKIINNYISNKNIEDIYSTEELKKKSNINAWDKSIKNKFFLGLKNSIYTIDYIIMNINNPSIFNIIIKPDITFINDIISIIIKHPELKNGISINIKTNTANQPKIHIKKLQEKFNDLYQYFKNYNKDIIINNLIIINNNIGLKGFKEIYLKEEQSKQINKNAWEKANELKFYLGLKNSIYNIDYIIMNINNPDKFI